MGWEPEPYYNITEVREHSSMPRLLKEKIGEFRGLMPLAYRATHLVGSNLLLN